MEIMYFLPTLAYHQVINIFELGKHIKECFNIRNLTESQIRKIKTVIAIKIRSLFCKRNRCCESVWLIL